MRDEIKNEFQNELKRELGQIEMGEERKTDLEEMLVAKIVEREGQRLEDGAAAAAVPEAAAAGTAAESGDKVTPLRRGRRSKRSVKVAVAIAACLALGCGAAYGAANYAGFFDGAFGTGWRSSVSAEQVATDGTEIICYPASEAVPVDQDEAKRLLGDAVSDDSATVAWPDGHVLTVDHVVRSEDVAVYHFTLHRDGGVTALFWDEGTNRAKGAAPADDCDYWWYVGDDDFIYVDPEASSADTLVGYGYTVFEEPLAAGEPVKLSVEPRESGASGWQGETVSVACTQTVEDRELSGDSGTAAVTPIGLTLNGEISHPDNIESIVVNFKDGSAYTVEDGAADLDNELAFCGFDGKRFVMAFNRLVDPDTVASVVLKVTDSEGGNAQTVTLK